MTILGREPALLLGLFASAVQLVSSLIIPLTLAQQGAFNAVAVTVIGVATAAAVSAERAVPALLGVVQAVLALALAFGLDLSQPAQGAVMAFAAAVASVIVRDRVTAPIPASAAR